MRIVYVDHCAQLSGAQLAMLRLLRALGERVEATVLLAEDGALADGLRQDGRAVEVVPLAPATRDLRGLEIRLAESLAPALTTAAYVAETARRIRSLRPDLVHTNSLKAAVYGSLAARLACRPAIVHVRDRIAPDFLPAPVCAGVRTALRLLPRALAGNETTLATVGARRVPTFAIVDPVEPRCFEVGRGQRPAGPLRVGMVGRLVPWKGQDVFLRAFAAAFADGDERAVLIGSPLCGDARWEGELRGLVQGLGISARVEFRGFRADVPAELERLDVAVHASVLPEPFGQVVTEAMAAGIPVVAADAGGPARIVDPGRTGLLTPPGDVGALARALAHLAADPIMRSRLGAAARTQAKAFSGEAAARQALAAYRAVAPSEGTEVRSRRRRRRR